MNVGLPWNEEKKKNTFFSHITKNYQFYLFFFSHIFLLHAEYIVAHPPLTGLIRLGGAAYLTFFLTPPPPPKRGNYTRHKTWFCSVSVSEIRLWNTRSLCAPNSSWRCFGLVLDLHVCLTFGICLWFFSDFFQTLLNLRRNFWFFQNNCGFFPRIFPVILTPADLWYLCWFPRYHHPDFFVTEWRRGLQELRILVVGNRYCDDEIISLNSLQIMLNDAKRSI